MITTTSVVHSKLDYCNSLFLNLESTQLNRLQLIQKSMALAVPRTPRHHHITPRLKSLHVLQISERIQFKVLSLTHNSLLPACELFTIQDTSSTRSSFCLALSRLPVTRGLLISCSPTKPHQLSITEMVPPTISSHSFTGFQCCPNL